MELLAEFSGRGIFYVVRTFHGGIFPLGEEFSMEGVLDFIALFKNDQK